MSRLLKIVGVVVLALVAVPGLILAAGLCLRLYAIHLAPLSMRSKVVSPDGRYTASIGCRGFMDESYDRTLFLQEGERGPRKVWVDTACSDDLKWSPDSRFIGSAVVYRNRQMREFSEGRPHREVPCVTYLCAVYDVRTGRHVTKRGDAELDVPADIAGEKLTWEWLDSGSIRIDIEYAETGNKMTARPVALLTIRDTGSGLDVFERRLMKVKGMTPV